MKKKRSIAWSTSCIIISILFAFANIYTKRLLYLDDIFVPLKGSEIFILLISSTIFFILIEFLSNISDFKFWDKLDNLKISKVSSKRIYGFVFIILFLTSVICFLTFFPGAANLDTYYILYYDTDMSRQHPMAYCLYVRIIKAMFLELGGYQLVIIVNSIIQILLWCAVLTYCTIWFLKRNYSKFWIMVTMLFYSLTPIYSVYVITMLKDTFFAILCILWIPLLIDIIDSKGEVIKKRFLYFIALSLVTSLLRSNAKIIVAILLVYLLVKFYKCYWKQLTLSLILVIIISSLPGMFMSYKGNPSWFQEKAGVLIQQVAAVAQESGEEAFSKDELALLNELMPIETIQKVYSPMNADFIKWDENFNRVYLNEHSTEFIKMWLHLLPNNFSTYVKAWLNVTYGFWSVNLREVRYWTDFGEYAKQIFPTFIQNILTTIYSKLLHFLNEAALFWLSIAISCAFFKKKKKYFIVLVPILINYITIFLSTPVAAEYRYVLMVTFSLPIIINILFEKDNKEKAIL